MMVTARKYNVGFLSDEELCNLFCVRWHELKMIVDTVRGNTGGANQHILVTGPRGCGKSTLLLRAVAEIRGDEDLRELWLPVVFMEESYEVGSIGEFWLECLYQIAQGASESEKAELLKSHGDLSLMLEDDEALHQRALARVLDFAERKEKRLALVVENLNSMFDDIPSDRQDITGWKLRQTLQMEPRIMLMGSAISRFEQITHPDKALFELFRPMPLDPLNTKECAVLWKRISGTEASGGARAIEILTGGSPRLITIVAQFGANLSLTQLLEELLNLVDDHTEYFKSHLESLPPKERRVYLALADLWKPATAREVAIRARQDIRGCSALLNRLIKRGVIIEEDTSTPRRKLYYLNERLYNIYYLLRRQRQTMVTALLNFMTAFYSRKKQWEIAWRLAEDCGKIGGMASEVQSRAFVGLYEQMGQDERLLDHTSMEFLKNLSDDEMLGKKMSKESNRLNEALSAAKDNSQIQRVVTQADSFISTISKMEEPESLRKSASLARILSIKGAALSRLGDQEGVITCCDELLSRFGDSQEAVLQGKVAWALINKGAALDRLGDQEGVITCCDELLSRFGDSQEAVLQGKVAWALINKGAALGELGNPEGELLCLNEAVERSEEAGFPESAIMARMSATHVLNGLGQKEEALKTIRAVLAQWPERIHRVPLDRLIEFLLEFFSTSPSREVVTLIEESRAAESLHPLITAFRQELGEMPRVSVEEREVAADIRERLSQKRNGAVF